MGSFDTCERFVWKFWISSSFDGSNFFLSGTVGVTCRELLSINAMLRSPKRKYSRKRVSVDGRALSGSYHKHFTFYTFPFSDPFGKNTNEATERKLLFELLISQNG